MRTISRHSPEWYAKKEASRKRAEHRFHAPLDLDPDKRSWYYDGDGTKRDKLTDKEVSDHVSDDISSKE